MRKVKRRNIPRKEFIEGLKKYLARFTDEELMAKIKFRKKLLKDKEQL